MSYSLK